MSRLFRTIKIILTSLPKEIRKQVEIASQKKTIETQRLCFGYGVIMILPNDETKRVYQFVRSTRSFSPRDNRDSEAEGTKKLLDRLKV